MEVKQFNNVMNLVNALRCIDERDYNDLSLTLGFYIKEMEKSTHAHKYISSTLLQDNSAYFIVVENDYLNQLKEEWVTEYNCVDVHESIPIDYKKLVELQDKSDYSSLALVLDSECDFDILEHKNSILLELEMYGYTFVLVTTE